MQRFTYNEKNRDDLLQYNGIDDNNRAEVMQRPRQQ